MSHEVRTPLNGILPILEMLRGTRLDETQQEFLDTAYSSSRHLLRIINDVLDFAKAESGKLEFESIELDLREDALRAVARKAIERRTGARGLRSILESVLLDTMYDMPSMDNVRRVVVDEAVVTGESAPYMLFDGGEPQRAASEQ